jgi:hypothetical protein
LPFVSWALLWDIPAAIASGSVLAALIAAAAAGKSSLTV